MVCVVLKFSAVEPQFWQRMKRALASLDTKPFICLITHPAHRRFFTPSRSTSRSPTLRTAKLLLLPPTRIKDLLICGVSKQLAWLSHFTVVAPKKKIVVVFTCIWESELDRLPNSWLLSLQAGHWAYWSNEPVYPVTEPRLLTSYKQTLRTVKELWDGAYNWFLLYSRMSNHRM